MPPASTPRAPRRRASIRTRITVVAVTVVAAVLAFGAVAVVWAIEGILTTETASRLESELDTLADALDDGTLDAGAIEDRDGDLLIAWHSDGEIVANDSDAERIPVPADDAPEKVSVDGEPFLVVAGEADDGILVIGRSLQDATEALAATRSTLLIGVPVAVLLIGLVVWGVITRALAPVERIRRQVDGIDAGGLDRRVPTTGSGDEIDRLATTMNRMLSRVEDGYRARQRFVGDASHELRSPLATMRQFAELTRAHPDVSSPAELADVVLDEGARMQDIVEGLLLLTRLDQSAVPTASVVDLDDLALAEVQRIRALGTKAVDGRGISPVQVVGESRLLARVVRNLVDNAVRHARSTVAVGTREDAGGAYVWVDDDGAGIPPGERERVFERFVRLDEARSRDAGGSGLGLAIVREIVAAHGGAVWVDESPAGGARFVVRMPVGPRS